MKPALPYRAHITGTGAYVPPRIVSNAEMAKSVDTSDEWIRTRTGIRERHLLDFEGQMGTGEMAEPAAREALARAGLKPTDLDMIIFASVTPDRRLPSAAALLAHRLGVPRAASFDVVAACAGSLFGISVAEKFIATGAAQRILVIGAETLSVITNWTDRNTCVLMGDGAGAVVLERSTSSGPGFIDTQLYTDANLWNAITIPAGGSKTPLTQALIDEHQDRMIMNGREVYKLATRVLPEAAERILKENGYGSDDVTHVVAHQANLRILEAVSDRLHIPMERFVTNIERYGNTSSASVLLTFDEAVRDGRMHPGDLVVMLAIGAGMAWAAALYRV